MNNEMLKQQLHDKINELSSKRKKVKKPLCIVKDCKTNASYNYEGETKYIYCAKHKKVGMEDKKNKKCIETGCKKQPCYNYEDKIKGVYCIQHKKDGMVNIKDKKCIEDKCRTHPYYNYEGEITAIYCAKHKKSDMVDVKSGRCKDNECKIQPSYNYEGESKALYCLKHKKDDMVDIKHKKCIENNCQIRPSFNYKGKTEALYCSKHKKDDMIDVVNPNCIHNISLVNCRLCDPSIHPKKWCANCKYVNIKKTPDFCKPYCFTCYCILNPDIQIKRQYRLKEQYLHDELIKEYETTKIVFNKKIDDGCSSRRPDVRIECLTHTIIIECDEHKHQGYSCENKRIMEIFQDLGNRPIIFLRFNPDSYKDENNIMIDGCFLKTNTIVNSLQKKEWERRIKILIKRINYHLTNIPEKEILVEQLFY